ncbi:MAG: PxKF domain-containing protein [Blastocatellia bacterium]
MLVVSRAQAGRATRLDRPAYASFTVGASSLTYDPTTDQYTYIWKTNAAWKNTCRQLIVKLNDDTTHSANFQFR